MGHVERVAPNAFEPLILHDTGSVAAMQSVSMRPGPDQRSGGEAR